MTSDVSERDRKVASCKSTTESRLPEVAAKLLSYVAASFSLALPRRQGQSREKIRKLARRARMASSIPVLTLFSGSYIKYDQS